MKFEIYPHKDGKVGYRLKGANGEIMFQAEGFHNAGNARRAIKTVKAGAREAEVVDLTTNRPAPILPADEADTGDC